MTEQGAVYKAIAAVQGDLAKIGIAKSGRNAQQGYNFRGIDQVYAALSPLLATHGLCILPRVISREVTERTTSKGGALFYVVLDVEFDLVAASDGSTHTIRTVGEAMDSADKATNKAMSAAYKYAALMAFAIPTEGDNDADATTHEVAARARASSVDPENPPEKRQLPLKGPIKTRAELRTRCGELVRDLQSCGDEDMLNIVLSDNKALIDQVANEAEFYWKGDGADFLGLEKEVANAKERVHGEGWRSNPMRAG